MQNRDVHSVVKLPPRATYQGAISIPASKSMQQRAFLLAALSAHPVTVIGKIASADSLAALSIIQEMGCRVEPGKDTYCIYPRTSPPTSFIRVSAGESGLCARMFLPVLSALYPEVTLTGTGSLKSRRLTSLIETMEQGGCLISHINSSIPIRVTGKIQPGKYDVSGKESSQIVSGLLLALTQTPGDSRVIISEMKSRPYVQMTLDMMKQGGLQVTQKESDVFFISGNQVPTAPLYEIEGDWSAASFHLVGAALSGSLCIKGLQPDSVQADRAILQVLRESGAILEWKGHELYVSKGDLHPFTFDASDCPDLFPPLAALASGIKGRSFIRGVSRLANKESNRANSIQTEWGKLGIDVSISGDIMMISGGRVRGGVTESHGDHRIAMGLSILSTLAEDWVVIQGANAVEKSYAHFFSDLNDIFTNKLTYE